MNHSLVMKTWQQEEDWRAKTAQHSVPENHRDNAPDPQQPRHGAAGAGGGSLRVFKRFAWLGVGSAKAALIDRIKARSILV